MAAGLTARTVQRAERSGHCSAETALALAGALDVDVSLLMVPPVTQDEAGSEGGRLLSRSGQMISFMLLRRLSHRQRAAWSLAALLPAAYFVTANILYYRFGWPWLYRPMQTVLANDAARTIFNLVSPALFLGGLGWAVALNLDAILSLRLVASEDPFSGTFRFRPRLANGVVLGVADIFLGILLLYLVVENAGHL